MGSINCQRSPNEGNVNDTMVEKINLDREVVGDVMRKKKREKKKKSGRGRL